MRALVLVVVALSLGLSLGLGPAVGAPVELRKDDISIVAPEWARVGWSFTVSGAVRMGVFVDGGEVARESAGPLTRVDIVDGGAPLAASFTNAFGQYSSQVQLTARGIHPLRAVVDRGTANERSSPVANVEIVTVPSPPRSFTATAGPSLTNASLGWLAPLDDGGSPITYRLNRQERGFGVVGVATFPAGTTSFVDQVFPDTQYSYFLTAENKAGSSAYVVAAVTTLLSPPATGLEADITGFRVCESSCVDLAPGDTYTSTLGDARIWIRAQASVLAGSDRIYGRWVDANTTFEDIGPWGRHLRSGFDGYVRWEEGPITYRQVGLLCSDPLAQIEAKSSGFTTTDDARFYFCTVS